MSIEGNEANIKIVGKRFSELSDLHTVLVDRKKVRFVYNIHETTLLISVRALPALVPVIPLLTAHLDTYHFGRPHVHSSRCFFPSESKLDMSKAPVFPDKNNLHQNWYARRRFLV